VALGRAHDVGRLEIAVDDALGVGDLESFGDFEADLEGMPRREGFFLHPLSEIPAFDVFHDDIRPAIAFAGLIDFTDERMVERRGRFGLAEKTFLGRGVGLDILWEEFDRHMAVEDRIMGQPDFAHSPFPKRVDEFVVSYALSGLKHFYPFFP